MDVCQNRMSMDFPIDFACQGVAKGDHMTQDIINMSQLPSY